MRFDVSAHTIFVGLSGSLAHGTGTADSDVDLRGVCIAPLSTRVSIFHRFEQYEGSLHGDLWHSVEAQLQRRPHTARAMQQKTESVVYDLAKLVSLLCAANPSALELLFTPEEDWLYETPAWRALYERRHELLTRRVSQTYLGYGLAQLRRIRTHRAWLLSPPARKPVRSDFGLPDSSTLNRDDQGRIERAVSDRLKAYAFGELELDKPTRITLNEKMDAFMHDAMVAAGFESTPKDVATRALGLPGEVIATLEAERRYRAAMKQWDAYRTWKERRNPERAKLEQQFGYDTKHAMHLIRLMTMGVEILETSELRVRRPDADELMAIRAGSLSFEELETRAQELEAAMKAALERTALPADVDREAMDRLVFELVRNASD